MKIQKSEYDYVSKLQRLVTYINNNTVNNIYDTSNKCKYYWKLNTKYINQMKQCNSNVFCDMFQLQFNQNFKQFLLQICGLLCNTSAIIIKLKLSLLSTNDSNKTNNNCINRTQIISTTVTFNYDILMQYYLPKSQNDIYIIIINIKI